MNKVKEIANIIIIILLVVVCAFLYFRKDTQIVKIPSGKTIEKRIETQKELLPTYTTVIATDKAMVKSLQSDVEDLMKQVEFLKTKNDVDTFLLVQKQDTLIAVLYKQGVVKDSLILNLERVSEIKTGIINNQDTLLAIKSVDLKRVKRQRNVSLIVNAILGTLLILK